MRERTMQRRGAASPVVREPRRTARRHRPSSLHRRSGWRNASRRPRARCCRHVPVRRDRRPFFDRQQGGLRRGMLAPKETPAVTPAISKACSKNRVATLVVEAKRQRAIRAAAALAGRADACGERRPPPVCLSIDPLPVSSATCLRDAPPGSRGRAVSASGPAAVAFGAGCSSCHAA
jgi:hypothetical protein